MRLLDTLADVMLPAPPAILTHPTTNAGSNRGEDPTFRNTLKTHFYHFFGIGLVLPVFLLNPIYIGNITRYMDTWILILSTAIKINIF